MTLKDLPQIEALSPLENLELVEEIWKSAGAAWASLEVLSEERAILDQRWSDFLQNPTSALGIEEFDDRVRTLRG